MDIPTRELVRKKERNGWYYNNSICRRKSQNTPIFPQGQFNVLGYKQLEKKEEELGIFSFIHQISWQIYGENNMSVKENTEKLHKKHVSFSKIQEKTGQYYKLLH